MSAFHKHCAWGGELLKTATTFGAVLENMAELKPVACQPQRDGDETFSLIEFHSPEGAKEPLKVSFQSRTRPGHITEMRAQIISAEESGLNRDYTEWHTDEFTLMYLVVRHLETLGYKLNL